MLGKSTDSVPAVVIAPLDTVNVVLDNPTLVTVPPTCVALTVILPLLPVKPIPVPAVNLVTPVLTIVMLPAPVIGLPEICKPEPLVRIPTLVTVPRLALEFAIFVIRPYWSTLSVG